MKGKKVIVVCSSKTEKNLSLKMTLTGGQVKGHIAIEAHNRRIRLQQRILSERMTKMDKNGTPHSTLDLQ